jgi:hypothetical protein
LSALKRAVNAIPLLVFVAIHPSAGRAQAVTPQQQFARDVYKELLEINTVTATGDTGAAAEAMAARLRAGGFPEADVQVFHPAPRKGDLVARMHGSGTRKPILLMAHIDVVEAKREDWSFDPFHLTVQDGYFYARGSEDDKFMAAALVSDLIRLKREGYKPDRDLILLLETDEEGGDPNVVGIRWMIKNHPDLINAAYALNEGGGIGTKNGRAVRNDLQTSEKAVINFTFETKNRGGHSSLPSKDNAIYRLAEGLTRLGKFDFPIDLNDTTRAWLERAAPLEDRQTGGYELCRVRSPGPRLRCAPDGDAGLQLATADHVRRDAARGRPCRECPAADGAGHSELPRAARGKIRRYTEDIGSSRRRRPDFHCAGPRRCLQPALAAHASVGSGR